MVNCRYLKPMDVDLLVELGRRFGRILTVEESALWSGFGANVGRILADHGVHVEMRSLGMPDRVIDHAARKIQLEVRSHARRHSGGGPGPRGRPRPAIGPDLVASRAAIVANPRREGPRHLPQLLSHLADKGWHVALDPTCSRRRGIADPLDWKNLESGPRDHAGR